MPPRRARFATAPALVLAVLAVSSCSGDGVTDPPPGPPSRIVLVIEPSPAAQTMVPLDLQPTVQIVDESGRATATVTAVTAEVVSGNGVIAAGGTATTDASGLAVFRDLTLGAANGTAGPLTVRFGAPGLAPVTAAIELRCGLLPLAIGQSVDRLLSEGDCTFASGIFVNFYEVTTSEPVTAVRLELTQLVRPVLLARGPSEPAYYWGWDNTGQRVAFTALLPAGRSRVAVATMDQGRTGSYTLSTARAAEDLTCEQPAAVVASPLTMAQRLGPGDCLSNSLYHDRVMVGLPVDASITVSMSSASFQPHISLSEAVTGASAASATAEGTAGFTFTNAGDSPKPYYLDLSSQAPNATGAYTLSLSISYPPSAPGIALPGLRQPVPVPLPLPLDAVNGRSAAIPIGIAVGQPALRARATSPP